MSPLPIRSHSDLGQHLLKRIRGLSSKETKSLLLLRGPRVTGVNIIIPQHLVQLSTECSHGKEPLTFHCVFCVLSQVYIFPNSSQTQSFFTKYKKLRTLPFTTARRLLVRMCSSDSVLKDLHFLQDSWCYHPIGFEQCWRRRNQLRSINVDIKPLLFIPHNLN